MKVLSNDILIINFDMNFVNEIQQIIDGLRDLGRNVFVFPDSIKISKQFSFADKNKFNFCDNLWSSRKDGGNIKIRIMDNGRETIQAQKLCSRIF